MNQATRHITPSAARQAGIVTTFTGVLILVLLTLMMFFAIRVGVFEQKVSSNDMRQKLAFHAAESGIHHAKEWLRANVPVITSRSEDVLPGGRHGWLSATDTRWLPCEGAYGSDTTHPCQAEIGDDGARRDTLFYYGDPDTGDYLPLPVDTGGVLPGATEVVDVYALLCIMEVDIAPDPGEAPVQRCVTEEDPDPADTLVSDGTYFMVNLLARGQADCVGTACNAEALVSEHVSNFGAAAGGRTPKVPLTTKSTFPPSGSAEVVPNPNSGGIGVPVSVWMNANSECSADGSVVDPASGSWATCEMHEWYGVDVLPEDYACPGNCSCSQAESISYTHSNLDILGIDLVEDTDFPCDLFQFYFGVPRDEYEVVKGYAEIINDCSALGPSSAGIYWATGAECRINSNTTVGSPENPVLLISAARLTRLNGGAKLYGTLFIADVENQAAELQSNGTNTVYGQVIVDGKLGSYQGTFQVVWNENTSRKAGTGGGLGNMLGGWTDNPGDWAF